jgi:hypothetical protein
MDATTTVGCVGSPRIQQQQVLVLAHHGYSNNKLNKVTGVKWPKLTILLELTMVQTEI